MDFDPCSVAWFSKGEYLIISGANKQCMLFSRDGIKLGTVAELQSWVWCSKVRPDSNFVVRIFDLLKICDYTISHTVSELKFNFRGILLLSMLCDH